MESHEATVVDNTFIVMVAAGLARGLLAKVPVGTLPTEVSIAAIAPGRSARHKPKIEKVVGVNCRRQNGQ